MNIFMCCLWLREIWFINQKTYCTICKEQNSRAYNKHGRPGECLDAAFVLFTALFVSFSISTNPFGSAQNRVNLLLDSLIIGSKMIRAQMSMYKACWVTTKSRSSLLIEGNVFMEHPLISVYRNYSGYFSPSLTLWTSCGISPACLAGYNFTPPLFHHSPICCVAFLLVSDQGVVLQKADISDVYLSIRLGKRWVAKASQPISCRVTGSFLPCPAGALSS